VQSENGSKYGRSYSLHRLLRTPLVSLASPSPEYLVDSGLDVILSNHEEEVVERTRRHSQPPDTEHNSTPSVFTEDDTSNQHKEQVKNEGSRSSGSSSSSLSIDHSLVSNTASTVSTFRSGDWSHGNSPPEIPWSFNFASSRERANPNTFEPVFLADPFYNSLISTTFWSDYLDMPRFNYDSLHMKDIMYCFFQSLERNADISQVRESRQDIRT
jgi:hypothetical protein